MQTSQPILSVDIAYARKPSNSLQSLFLFELIRKFYKPFYLGQLFLEVVYLECAASVQRKTSLKAVYK